MAIPLFVPGHPTDNPPTTDLWPHLAPDLQPLFAAEDGTDPHGPIHFRSATVTRTSADIAGARSEPGEAIENGELGLTDSRVLFMGLPGDRVAPGRRLMGQFRMVWLTQVEHSGQSGQGPATVVLHGLQQDEGAHWAVRVAVAFEQGVNTRALAEEITRRGARQQFRLDLVAPEDRSLMLEAAQAQFPLDRPMWRQQFARSAVIAPDTDYRQGGVSLAPRLSKVKIEGRGQGQ